MKKESYFERLFAAENEIWKTSKSEAYFLPIVKFLEKKIKANTYPEAPNWVESCSLGRVRLLGFASKENTFCQIEFNVDYDKDGEPIYNRQVVVRGVPVEFLDSNDEKEFEKWFENKVAEIKNAKIKELEAKIVELNK